MSLQKRSTRLFPYAIFVVAGVTIIFTIAFTAAHLLTIVEITPSLTRNPERCLTCHTGIESIGVSHPTSQFGCVSCHGGQALATDATKAHEGVVRNPGDLAVADKYCGSCHAAQTALVPRSIMSTYAGAIALVRRTFGLQLDGTALYATTLIDHLQAFTPTSSDPAPVQKFAANCLNCHTHSQAIQAPYFYRSTGCSSCHVLYGDAGLYQGGDPTIPHDQPGHATLHQITKQIPYTQCNHCHNRGNYDLRSMTFLNRTDLPLTSNLAADQERRQTYYQPIGKFTRCEYELDCIDCHTKLEVMGDGVLHNNRSEAQYVQCQTCHGTRTSPPLASGSSPLLNPTVSLLSQPTTLMTVRGEALSNVQLLDGRWILTSKVSGKTYTVPMVQGSQCPQKPDEQASNYCHECHSVAR